MWINTAHSHQISDRTFKNCWFVLSELCQLPSSLFSSGRTVTSWPQKRVASFKQITFSKELRQIAWTDSFVVDQQSQWQWQTKHVQIRPGETRKPIWFIKPNKLIIWTRNGQAQASTLFDRLWQPENKFDKYKKPNHHISTFIYITTGRFQKRTKTHQHAATPQKKPSLCLVHKEY